MYIVQAERLFPHIEPMISKLQRINLTYIYIYISLFPFYEKILPQSKLDGCGTLGSIILPCIGHVGLLKNKRKNCFSLNRNEIS